MSRAVRWFGARALAVTSLVVGTAVEGCGAEESIACADLCRAVDDCGLLPSELGGSPNAADSCTARCALAGSDLGEIIEQQCSDAVDQVKRRVTDGGGLWCRDSQEGACLDVAQCLGNVFGLPAPLGEARARVGLVASAKGTTDCTTGACRLGDGSCARPIVATACVVDESGAKLDAACGVRPVGLESVSDSSFAAEAGATQLRARLLDFRGATSWRTLHASRLDSPTWFDLPAGPVQAEVEIRGALPTFSASGSETPDGSPSPRLTVPSGGLVGDYCWVFRSGVELLSPGDGVHTITASVAPTAAHAVARAWRQADLAAKAVTNPAPVLYACETGLIECLDGIDNDGDGVSDCGDSNCAVYCSDVESSATACSNGEDDDGDGAADCRDPGCAAHCEQSQVECRDGGDNDLDGLEDCRDPDCAWLCDLRGDPCGASGASCGGAKRMPQVSCPTLPTGGPDCSDRACAWKCGIEWPDTCDNGLDDDADGLTDLADPDCPGPEDSALRCADDLDNDCTDPMTGAPCAMPGDRDCSDAACNVHCPPTSEAE